MSFDESEEVKRLAELKVKLQEKLESLREEAKTLEFLISVIDSLLVSKSFRRIEVPQSPQAQPAQIEVGPAPRVSEVSAQETVLLEASDGALLAKMYVTDGGAQVVIEPGLNLYVSTPPFQSFLVSRVLESMKSKDLELVREGKLNPDRVFDYELKVEGDAIKEIRIRNYGDKRRLRELRTSIRWTLEKMYEKLKAQ
ncbi:hypothetical protein KEJ17_03780 [Candidatus Bathyarchaeota archaeon]|nr:hypothetical protein [Candidatus Bathyarchaeota archaeon]